MHKYELVRSPAGDKLRVPVSGSALMRFPLYNKGTGFTLDERRKLKLEGALPAQHNDIETQADRSFRTIMFNDDPVGRHISLAALQDRNEHLYYRVLRRHLEELMPIVYTPTVGKASQYFSRVFRRGRGIWITPEHRGRIAEVLQTAAPYSDVELMVVTDNESILGIGDQGAGGMAISVGKLALYCAGAGIHPARTLPISLDVGTDNQSLLDDSLYLGWRQPRLRGSEYESLVAEFIDATRHVFPSAMIQWEDFRKDNALQILDRYRDVIPSFNDDIQGTGAVAVACLIAAGKISKQPVENSRILIYGAGAAGLGIARQLRELMRSNGVTDDALWRSILVMDSRGMLTDGRENLDAYKKEMAWPEQLASELFPNLTQRRDLAGVVSVYRPTALVGASGQANAFNEVAVTAMAAHIEQPAILAMSNPTSISEGIPEDILRWTDGKALVATGSPFEDVIVDGNRRRIGQANNVFVFPGLGLGAIVSGARQVTDGMITASSKALAASLSTSEIEERCLMPKVSRLWEVCGDVGVAVARQAVSDGVSDMALDDIEQKVSAYRWTPRYPEIICD